VACGDGEKTEIKTVPGGKDDEALSPVPKELLLNVRRAEKKPLPSSWKG